MPKKSSGKYHQKTPKENLRKIARERHQNLPKEEKKEAKI